MEKRFRLDKVLYYRNVQLEKERLIFAKLESERRVIQQNLDEANEVIELKREEKAIENEKGNYTYAHFYDRFIQMGIIQASYLEQDLAIKEKEVINERTKLEVALRNTKILEKLEAEHKLAYLAFLKENDQKQTDERNTLRRKPLDAY